MIDNPDDVNASSDRGRIILPGYDRGVVQC